MKRTASLSLVLLLAASVAFGAQRKTLLKRVRQQTGSAFHSIGREMKSWMATMRRQVTGLRRGITQGAKSITTAGRRSADQLKGTFGYLSQQTRRHLHSGMTLVAREFVPVGEEAAVRPVTTVAVAVQSPVAEPVFLRRYDIVLAWHITTGGRPVRRSHLLDENLLLEDTGNDIYALNPRNGIANWVFPLPAPSMYPYVADAEAIAVIVNDVLYELDRDVGLPRRRFVLPFPTAARPALRGKSIIIASADDRLRSLQRETRVRDWTYLVTDHIRAGIAVAANTVYYAQTDGKVFAYQPGRRKPLWEYKADDTILVTLVVEGNNLYFPAHDLFVHALNRFGGFRIWKFPVRGKVTQPVWVEQETIYFSADGDGFYAVDRDKGEMLWHVPGAKWPVAVGQKNIYLEGPNRTLLAVDRDTGKEVWRISAKPFTHFVRNTTTDHIYLVTERGQVYAFYLRGDHIEKKKIEKPLGPPETTPPVEEPERAAPEAPPAEPTPKAEEEKKKEEEEF